MAEYLNDEMDESWDIDLINGTYAEITTEHGSRYEVHASGNGDFNHHKVEFKAIKG